MNDKPSAILDLLRRQAEWQAAQARLSWPEKVKLAEAIRNSIATLRKAELGSDPI